MVTIEEEYKTRPDIIENLKKKARTLDCPIRGTLYEDLTYTSKALEEQEKVRTATMAMDCANTHVDKTLGGTATVPKAARDRPAARASAKATAKASAKATNPAPEPKAKAATRRTNMNRYGKIVSLLAAPKLNLAENLNRMANNRQLRELIPQYCRDNVAQASGWGVRHR